MSDDERQRLEIIFWFGVALLAAGSAFVYLWLSWAEVLSLDGWIMAGLIAVAFVGQAQVWPTKKDKDRAE